MSLRPPSLSGTRFVSPYRWLAALASLALAACSSTASPAGPEVASIGSLSPAGLADGEKLRVVATTSIVADVVSTVGGERLTLTTLLPANTDPHTYEPTPQDLRAVADAHIVFINGLGLEVGLLETLKAAAGTTPIASVSEGIEGRSLDLGAAEGGNGRDHGGLDPHVWFDPTLVATWVGNVAAALSALDPDQAPAYEGNALAYRTQLEELDAWIQSQVSQIPMDQRKLVTDHEQLGYFADRYGFEIVGAVIPAYSTAAEPSPGDLADLQETIGRLAVRAIFVGASVNPAQAQRVAQDTGVALVVLYTESLSGPEGPAATYLDFMRHNVAAIVEALLGIQTSGVFETPEVLMRVP